MKLQLSGVSKRLGPRSILRDVGLQCGDGELAVILGENGSGKSTLLRLVAGVIEPDRGHIRIDQHEVRGGGVVARRHLAFVPDASDPLPDLAVDEFLALVAALKRAPLPPPALYERLSLQAIGSQRMGSLSFGQRKRVCLLAAHIGDPWLWLLDEPSNGIDPAGVQLIHALIAERGARGQATLLSTNDQAFAAALSGQVYRLQGGALTAAGVSG
jgi:ABC-type multidrug transport system ATPase subunit